MVPNSRGKVTTPSVVSFKKRRSDKAGGGKGGEGGGGLARIVIGEAALARIASHPRNTYSSVKRVVGRTRKEAKEAGVGLGALNVDQVRARQNKNFFFFVCVCFFVGCLLLLFFQVHGTCWCLVSFSLLVLVPGVYIHMCVRFALEYVAGCLSCVSRSLSAFFCGELQQPTL